MSSLYKSTLSLSGLGLIPRLNEQDRVPFGSTRSEANCCSDRDLVLMTFSRTNKPKLYHVTVGVTLVEFGVRQREV